MLSGEANVKRQREIRSAFEPAVPFPSHDRGRREDNRPNNDKRKIKKDNRKTEPRAYFPKIASENRTCVFRKELDDGQYGFCAVEI